MSINPDLQRYDKANRAYHSGEAIISDLEFDELEKRLKRDCPNDPRWSQVGAEVKKGKVPLPFKMNSLVKIRPGGDLIKWFRKIDSPNDEIVISNKLDGISLLLVYDKGKLQAAYTRGDGHEGQLVTHHVLHMPSVPKVIPYQERLAVRAEGYMDEKDFENNFKDKYKNARNMVAGMFNRKKSIESELKFVKAETYHIFNDGIDKKDILNMLRCNNFKVVTYKVMKSSELSDIHLSKVLELNKQKAPYQMDGLVLEINDAGKRDRLGLETNSINPVYARAFKTDELEEMATTEVLEVQWKVSKDGYIKPKLKVKPVELAGVTVQHATAFNAKFIVENKLGPGAVVKITRSGDVIPYIKEVISTTSSGASLPSKEEFGSYNWNASEVDLVTTVSSDDQKIEQLIFFFQTMNAENFSSGLVKRFYEHGFDTPFKILRMSKQDIMKHIPNMKEKSSERVLASFKKAFTVVELPILMAASGCFGRGFGRRKSKIICDTYHDKIFSDWVPTSEEITELESFSDKTAALFIEGISDFRSFCTYLSPYTSIAEKPLESNFNPLRIYAFTGFRDKELQERLEDQGYEVGNSITKKTTHLVCKDPNSGSSKIKKAQKMGIEIVGLDQLIEG